MRGPKSDRRAKCKTFTALTCSHSGAGAESRQLRGIAHEEGAPNNNRKRLGMRFPLPPPPFIEFNSNKATSIAA